MDLRTFRIRLAFIILAIFIVWPIFHIIMVKSLKISSWRLFGWGMYSTPNPEAQSRLHVVINNKNMHEIIDMAQLHASITQLSFLEAEKNLCINVFLKEPGQIFKKLSHNDLCRDHILVKHLDYFLHFGSSKHLRELIKEVLFHVEKSESEVYAFLMHQRFNIFKRKAYLESDIYKFSDDEVQYLGRIKNEG